ncbi:hypothetical protein BHE74_00030280 [Ensete ventricosum]|nr:hypothetical protein GW17_00018336 [Ensete ventricosum]RWW62580.1 hypothetical protein BHE74_00030280 [Ensete ventricosum]RZS12046.1 hypothetical protein BHM03_00043439 [Ensete ventricosum]
MPVGERWKDSRKIEEAETATEESREKAGEGHKVEERGRKKGEGEGHSKAEEGRKKAGEAEEGQQTSLDGHVAASEGQKTAAATDRRIGAEHHEGSKRRRPSATASNRCYETRGPRHLPW